jgi:FkbM family methyltransferase
MKLRFGLCARTSDDNSDFVTVMYRGLLGREPDESGLKFYTNALRNGEIDKVALINSVLSSAEFKGRSGVEICSGSGEPFGCLQSEALTVFARFQKYEGPGREGFVTNFLGGLTNVYFVSGIDFLSGVVEGYPIPGNFHGDTSEWIGTLRSTLEASGKFIMLELGAGWAPWCVIGYLAARQCGIGEIKVIGIEGDVGHVEFIRETFATNDIGPDVGKGIHGVVGVTDGEALFPKATDASRVYGGAAAFSEADIKAGAFAEFVASQSELVKDVERLPCYSLATLMQGFDKVDLIHCDIQGAELEVLTSSIDQICAKVKRIVIGTHSFEIERNLACLFPKIEWNLEAMSACLMTERTGRATVIRDGVQVWRNLRL